MALIVWGFSQLILTSIAKKPCSFVIVQGWQAPCTPPVGSVHAYRVKASVNTKVWMLGGWVGLGGEGGR